MRVGRGGGWTPPPDSAHLIEFPALCLVIIAGLQGTHFELKALVISISFSYNIGDVCCEECGRPCLASPPLDRRIKFDKF